ncbi:MAG: helix-turn-helix domain-containing protein, partial [candidate division Zixibacteria bacterium]|nr:helix-turn-helix domain-containing protein [candidate division Zixibacteria bacterium]
IIGAGFANRKTFAGYAHVDEGNLSRLINGKVQEPRASTLVRISTSLGISIDEMVRRAGYTNGSSAKDTT